jgi:ABC-type bacteriocin/lantibiotic exporter with double-glycine peptidase domain
MQIECHNLTFRYPGADTAVFEDLSFRMTGPGFHALFGPSGVGKTSIARMLIGDLDACSGALQTGGIDRILYSYNLERLPGWSAVGKHLERITTPAQRDKKEHLVDLFGMAPYLESRFAQLSLGQKNRINLIRYLLQDFQMLIMDESLANVDERTREKIILNIKALFPNKFFIYISHNIVEVSKYCRQILVLAGAGHQRPAMMVQGQDQQAGQVMVRQRLETTMLEIMNAA